MTRARLLLLATAGITTALAVSVVPAFTATPSDSGSVVGTVTALGGGACLQLSNTAVGFGTLPFSTRTQLSSASGNPTPTFQNCGNFNESISIAGSDATGTNALWQLTTKYGGNPCVDSGGLAQTNAYGLAFDAAPVGHVRISTTATPIATYAAGAATPLALTLDMPCIGSSGDGQVVSFSVNLTAAVA
jgi:hypothetical protein